MTTDQFYDSFLGVTIKRFYTTGTPDSTIGSEDDWKRRLRQLAFGPSNIYVPTKVVPLEVFRGLTVEIYQHNYTPAGNNPNDVSNASIRLDTRGLTKSTFPGIIGISVNVGDATQSGNESYQGGILSRQFGQYYGYRCNVLTSPSTGQTIRDIHTELSNLFVSTRTAILTAESPAPTGDFPLSNYRMAEDYRFLLGTPLSLLKFTPTVAAPSTPHAEDTSTDIQAHPEYITLLKTMWSLQRYLSNRAYSSLTLNDHYFQWKLDNVSIDTSSIYQALTDELVWYDWSIEGNQWIPVGSDSSQLNSFYTATPPLTPPI